MYTVHDFRQTGMPELGVTATPGGEWALAERLGITEHAFVTPMRGEYRDTVAEHRRADALGQLALAAVLPPATVHPIVSPQLALAEVA